MVEAQAAWLRAAAGYMGEAWQPFQGDELMAQWLAPDLRLAHTCGYPLVTQLWGKVRVVGTPRYELVHSSGGTHCSLVLCREQAPFVTLADAVGSRGLVNGWDSNSGMNLFRHTLQAVHDGAFFSEVIVTGGHRASMHSLRQGLGDLAAVDSITYDYLAREYSEEVQGLRVLARSVRSPCLPLITSLGSSDAEVEVLREALNWTLPEFAVALGIEEVMPAAAYGGLLQLEAQVMESRFSWA
ncbi:phosphate/phosphite/phosphonate ABC transporter substrate-binding protein [Pseudomonas sp. KNUC1026]|uniref:phosphate/phosphite/phosphonate ABC transporter substrate-binding protein n=1 Tax=Pseudomonas sp. KNUC1026 TaxID=2893890 RepID=UPI001F3BD571|nr:PhnD/SsuA/transferrin family substrate-binding protein [Pseudomonas sp. KNUC1026]UFH49185.1 PhnD/SsuA/transferrin family substrate-binding protein [Pseudomonas sp. KNUC1026]